MRQRFESGGEHRSYLILAAVFCVALLSVTWIELRLLAPGTSLTYILRPGVADADRMIGHLTRTTIQLMMLFTTVTAIAVPLTANLYTPRLLDLFVRDRVNRGFLILLIFSAVLVHFTLYAMRDNLDLRFGPPVLVNATALSGFLCMFLSVPYVFYMFNFLRPSEIVRRMREALAGDLEGARRDDTPARRQRIAALVEQIGEVALRAAGRDDAGMAVMVIDEIEQIAGRYRELKPRLPESWFEGYPRAELIIPPAAIEHLRAEHTWFEFHLLKTLDHALPVAMTHTPDVASRIGRVARVVAAAAGGDDDPAVVRLGLKFFNTFLRRALGQRQVRAFYNFSNQYRMLGEALLASPEPWSAQVAESLAYYAGEAHTAGQAFARDTALYDLADLLVAAVDRHHPLVVETVGLLVGAYRATDARLEPAVKALAAALAAGEKRVVAAMESVLQGGDQAAAVAVVLSAETEEYREVTDRVVDLNHVSPAAREALRAWWAARAEQRTTAD